MTKSSKDLAVLFRSLEPDNATVHAVQQGAVSAAQQRWPLLQSASARAWGDTPTLSADAKTQAWATPAIKPKKKGGKRSLPLPVADKSLAGSLRRMSGRQPTRRADEAPAPASRPARAKSIKKAALNAEPTCPDVDAPAAQERTADAPSPAQGDRPEPHPISATAHLQPAVMPATEASSLAAGSQPPEAALPTAAAPAQQRAAPLGGQDALASVFGRLRAQAAAAAPEPEPVAPTRSGFMSRLGKR